MAQRFKAKTLISNSGVFNNEVIAPNLVYNTGKQTIAGIKTFEVGNVETSKVIISGSQAGDYALSVINNSNQGNVLFLKKGINPGGGTVSNNFVIKAVNRSDRLIFTLKSNQGGVNRAGFFCDAEDVNGVGGPDVSSNSLVISGRTYTIDGEGDDWQYILSDSNSIQGINQFYSYTGGLFFNDNGLNLKFIDQNGNYPLLNPIEVTTGNDVLINGNYSFGSYTNQITGSGTSNFRLFKTDRLQNILQNIKTSGIKTGNTITVFSSGAINDWDYSSSLGKAAQYLVIPSGDIQYNSYNTIRITGGIYSGLALRKFKTGPTIKNDYKYNFSLLNNANVVPRERSLETIYEVNVPDGGDAVRYLNFQFPTVTTSNNAIITLKFNFEASSSPCSVVCDLQSNARDPSFTVNAANYDFTQIERVMHHYREGIGSGFYVRIWNKIYWRGKMLYAPT